MEQWIASTPEELQRMIDNGHIDQAAKILNDPDNQAHAKKLSEAVGMHRNKDGVWVIDTKTTEATHEKSGGIRAPHTEAPTPPESSPAIASTTNQKPTTPTTANAAPGNTPSSTATPTTDFDTSRATTTSHSSAPSRR